MAANTPVGRAFEAERDAEAAREAEGIYVKERLADLLRSGEKSYEEALDIIKAGKLTYRRNPYPADTVDPEEQEANSSYDPFMVLTIGASAVLTPEQHEALLAAENEAVGRPGGFTDDEFDEAFFEGNPYSDHRYAFGRVHDDGPYEDVYRVDRIFIERWQPQSRTWLDASSYAFPKLYGPHTIWEREWTTAEKARDFAKELSLGGGDTVDLTEDDVRGLAELLNRPLERNGPYWD